MLWRIITTLKKTGAKERANNPRSILDVVTSAQLNNDTTANSVSNSTNELLHDVIPSQNRSDTNSLKQRAPPYDDPCEVNHDCDWGYRCIERACKNGCDDSDDCIPPQFCKRVNRENRCMFNERWWCFEHLRFCNTDSECCSHSCKPHRPGSRLKVCKPTPGGRNGDGKSQVVESSQ